MGGHKGIAWRERGDYLCGYDRGEGSRFRADLVCCVGVFVSPPNGHMRITAGLRYAAHSAAWPSATRSVVTAVAEKQSRNRLCPPRRFVNPRAVIRNAAFCHVLFVKGAKAKSISMGD